MASTYTTRIKLEKQGDGENANTWGQRLNNNVIDVLDDAVAGYHTVNIEGLSGDVTLSDGDGNAANTARNFGLNIRGSMSGDVTIVVPAREKIYFVNNESTNGTVFIKPTGGTAVTVARSMMVATSGTIMDTLTGFTPDNISSNVSIQGNLFVSGNVSIGGTVSAPNVRAGTEVAAPKVSGTNIHAATKVHAPTVSANTVNVITKIHTPAISATHVSATNVYVAGNVSVGGAVSAPNIYATTKLHTPTVSANTVNAVTKIHTPAISATHVSATNVKISSNLSVGGTVSVGGAIYAPTVSAATVKVGSLLIGGQTKDNFASGTKLAFNNSTAPIGWTIDTASSKDNAALRIVTSNGGNAGGSNTFTSKFNSTQTITISGNTGSGGSFSGSTGSTTLTLAQIPSHDHDIRLFDASAPSGTNLRVAATDDVGDERTGTTTNPAGSSQGHDHSINIGTHLHSFSDTDTFNFDVKYVDFIICEKD